MRPSLRLLLACAAIGPFLAPPPAPADTPPLFEARWSVSGHPVYVGERFLLTLEVIGREGSLTKKISLDGLPPTNHLTCEPFADLPVELKSIDDRMCEIRRFRAIAALNLPGPCPLRGTLHGTQIRRIQHYFFTQREERPISVSPPELRLEAWALPLSNRPPEFTGAIGSGFAFSAQLAPTSPAVGDLIEVKMSVHSDSPLARLAPPVLPDDPEFKSYPLKADAASPDPARRRDFSQIIIPLSDQVRAWGPVSFAYFDPRRGDYIVLTQGPFPLSVMTDRPDPAAGYRPPIGADEGSPRPAAPALRPGPYPGHTAYAKLYESGAFAEALALPGALASALPRARADELYNRAGAWIALDLPEKAAPLLRAALHLEPRDPALRREFNRLTAAHPAAPAGRIADRATRAEWLLLMGVGVGLLIAGLLGMRRRTGPGALVLVAGLTLCGWAGVGVRHRIDLARRPEAILLADSTPVRQAPSDSAPRYADLPRGTWIRIQERHENWRRIAAESISGWVPAASLAEISPWLEPPAPRPPRSSDIPAD